MAQQGASVMEDLRKQLAEIVQNAMAEPSALPFSEEEVQVRCNAARYEYNGHTFNLHEQKLTTGKIMWPINTEWNPNYPAPIFTPVPLFVVALNTPDGTRCMVEAVFRRLYDHSTYCWEQEGVNLSNTANMRRLFTTVAASFMPPMFFGPPRPPHMMGGGQ
ncbi:hypothetical protein LTR97_004032 [Elasticomyces elasticus]|uniref:Uncharacterized protein n=1 Tax=Elasticomyces elasticus TaxID=574655 RepID=A0AAN8A3Z3_9PEZI|nr:hypothetical protein LTR97_004032 [Elasticomyces elasticus]